MSEDLPFNAVESWFPTPVQNLQYELPCGKIATDLVASAAGVTFMACAKFGSNGIPYAKSTAAHRNYLDSPDVAATEGSVTYSMDGEEDLTLPARVWFEETVEFDQEVTTVDELAAALEETIADATGVDVTVEPTEEVA